MTVSEWCSIAAAVTAVGGAAVTVAAAFATFGTKLDKLGKETEELKQTTIDRRELDKLSGELAEFKRDNINRREFDSFKEVIKAQYENIAHGQARVEELFGGILKRLLEDRR